MALVFFVVALWRRPDVSRAVRGVHRCIGRGGSALTGSGAFDVKFDYVVGNSLTGHECDHQLLLLQHGDLLDAVLWVVALVFLLELFEVVGALPTGLSVRSAWMLLGGDSTVQLNLVGSSSRSRTQASMLRWSRSLLICYPGTIANPAPRLSRCHDGW